jgi:hypothetical protein
VLYQAVLVISFLLPRGGRRTMERVDLQHSQGLLPTIVRLLRWRELQ